MSAQPISQRGLWRVTDPTSSGMAAEEIDASGRRAAQKAAILAAVEAHPGSTASELSDWCGLDAVQIRKRLPDLKADEKVIAGPVRMGKFRHEQTWSASNTK